MILGIILNFTANLPECIRKDYARVCTHFCVMELNHSGKEIASLTHIYELLLTNTQQNLPLRLSHFDPMGQIPGDRLLCLKVHCMFSLSSTPWLF